VWHALRRGGGRTVGVAGRIPGMDESGGKLQQQRNAYEFVGVSSGTVK